MPVSDPRHDRGAVVPAGRPVTVWPCPPDAPDGPAADWLHAAVHRLATNHSRPGDPVLLLTPPPQNEAAPHPADTDGDDTFDGLSATVESLTRLGRQVRVRTASNDPTSIAAQSRPGLATGLEADLRHALVVTVVAPTRLAWLAHVPWSLLLTSGGLLAVITRSDSVAGWLVDPTGDLLASTRRHGLTLLDRFVLLEVPLDQLDDPPTPLPRGTVARRVHSDLLLFTPVASATSWERR